MVEGKTYLIRVLLYDRERNEILLTKNLDFGHAFDKKLFSVIDQNLIGSELIV